MLTFLNLLQIRNKQSIIQPEEYIKIYERHATVINLMTDVNYPVHDWKAETARVIRPPTSWHFKFSEAKRFILTKSK